MCALLQAPLLALWWRLFPSAEAEGLAGYPPSAGAGGLAAARLLALLKVTLTLTLTLTCTVSFNAA